MLYFRLLNISYNKNMLKITKKLKKDTSKRGITLVIVSSLVILFFFSGFSIGKGYTKTDIETTGEIAKPILEVTNGETISMKQLGDTGTYEFFVRNYNGEGKITDVALEYYIEILNDINQNIELKIYKEEKEIELNQNKTETFTMPAKQEQVDNYKIEIKCKENISVSEIIENIQIKVHSEQVES